MADFEDEPDDLIDPDVESGSQYDGDHDHQRSILSLLLADRAFLMRSLNIVKPTYFKHKAHQAICSVLFKFFEKYAKIPKKEYIKRLLADRFKDDEAKFFYLGALQELYDAYEPGLDSREYLQEELANFAQREALMKAFSQSITEMNSAKDADKTAVWDKIRNLLKDALAVNLDFDPGLDYFGTLRERYERMGEEQETREVFETGYLSIDRALNKGGLRRGEVGSIMGLSGVGKSLFLVKVAVHNILKGKKVLYISLEMSEDDIAARFDAQFAKVAIKTLYQNREEVIKKAEQVVEEFDDKKMFLVKQFAAGTADVNIIRAYVQQLRMQNFVPDLVIVDYVGEMKDYTGISIHESRKRLVTELRGFATEANVCVLTAMQVNRGGKESQKDGGVIGAGDLAAAFDQAQPLDALWSVNQTDPEKTLNIGRINIDKHRDGRSKFWFPVYFDPDTLEIKEISPDEYRAAINNYKEKASDEVELDKLLDSKAKKPKKKRLETTEEPE